MRRGLVCILILIVMMLTALPAYSTENENRTVSSHFKGDHFKGACQTGFKDSDYVVFDSDSTSFKLVADGQAATMVVSDTDYPGVIRAADDLKNDIAKVTDVEPALIVGEPSEATEMVIIGTIGKSTMIDNLIEEGKLDVTDIKGAWETFLITSVENPFSNVESALVITGSDQRGTIFGIYDLSKKIGISPWHFWDDVPPIKRNALYVRSGRHSMGEPKVKYRGVFINDENPDLGTWGPEYFGPGEHPDYPNGFNKALYAKIFEVMLRMKANYLWPAVWGRAFADDDPENHATATLYGIVMGTSHEAPMMRGIEEWNRYADTNEGTDPYGGNGEWRYSTNSEALELYWQDGIQRMVDEDFEGIITLGMRGPGDISLPVGDGIELIESVISKQREIIADVTGEDVTTIPQVWTLYKEIQDYWDEGIRVPDDVTVVWCDDNWGNIRKLPDQSLEERSGGYGVYYHFDYVGGGRNYKWVDTILLSNIWEQMHLAYEYGVDRLWVVNVGDLKNEELSTEFFLDYAWNPDLISVEEIPEWEEKWAKQQFGEEFATRIAEILSTYGKLQSDRKPELLNRKITLDSEVDITVDPDNAVVYEDGCPFSLTDYREMERVTAQWQELAEEAETVRNLLPEEFQDAYYQLVFYQVKASTLMYEIRLAGFKNLLYAEQQRAATSDMADIAQQKFDESTAMADYYNNDLAGGKWHNWQLQPYLGYGGDYPNSSWQQPETNNVADPDFIWPELVTISIPAGSEMAVAIDGSGNIWPDEQTEAILPTFSPFQSQPAQYIEVVNRGSEPFDYTIVSDASWIVIDPAQGTVDKEVRSILTIDWSGAPEGTTEMPITVTGPDGASVIVKAVIENPQVDSDQMIGFVESNGYVSMESEHFSNKVETQGITWENLPGIGRTGAGMTPFPVTAATQTPGNDSSRLEYDMHLFSEGEVTVWVYLSPRNNVLNNSDGLKYAVSIDDDAPQIVNITTTLNGIPMNKSWERNTSDNVNLTSTKHVVNGAGHHVLKFWMVDPTVVLQKIVVDTGGLKSSYLGPPESWNVNYNK